MKFQFILRLLPRNALLEKRFERSLRANQGLLLTLGFGSLAPHAQSQMSTAQQGARAQQIQLSDREQGNVSAQQNASQGAASGVSVVQPNVNISGRYTGSVTDPNLTNSTVTELPLSYEDAIQRGLRSNFGTAYLENAQRVTRAQRSSALSQILPSVTGTLSQTIAQSYLPSIGITSSLLGGMVKIPDVTGQYHFYILQGSVSEDLLDAQNATENAREFVIFAVGGSYVQAISTAALITAQRDQVRLAEANYKQAEDQHNAGTRAAIDANRNLVQLRTEQLRLGSDAENAIGNFVKVVQRQRDLDRLRPGMSVEPKVHFD